MSETAKVMISLPKSFLVAIDKVAKEERRTRSELLREAARRYMEGRRPPPRPIDRPEVREAVAMMDRLAAQSRPIPGWDAAHVVRRDRNRDSRRARA